MPWWGKSQEAKPEESLAKDIPATGKSTAFDPAKLPNPEKLPQKLQQLVDKADEDNSFFDNLKEG